MNAPNPSGWRPSMEAGAPVKATTASGDHGLALEEPLIFELAGPCGTGVDFDAADEAPAGELARFLRAVPAALPGGRIAKPNRSERTSRQTVTG